MSEPTALVVMRLADMHKVHPEQDNSRRCMKCDWPVGIYPSGVRTLRNFPEMAIICMRCASGQMQHYDDYRSAGSVEEIRQEIAESKDA